MHIHIHIHSHSWAKNWVFGKWGWSGHWEGTFQNFLRRPLHPLSVCLLVFSSVQFFKSTFNPSPFWTAECLWGGVVQDRTWTGVFDWQLRCFWRTQPSLKNVIKKTKWKNTECNISSMLNARQKSQYLYRCLIYFFFWSLRKNDWFSTSSRREEIKGTFVQTCVC